MVRSVVELLLQQKLLLDLVAFPIKHVCSFDDEHKGVQQGVKLQEMARASTASI